MTGPPLGGGFPLKSWRLSGRISGEAACGGSGGEPWDLTSCRLASAEGKGRSTAGERKT